MVEPKIQERGPPRGSVENVPSRTGQGDKDHFSRANQDEFTDKRRAHYGDTERYVTPIKSGNQDILTNPNDTKTINNPTKLSQIIGTFQRTSVQ